MFRMTTRWIWISLNVVMLSPLGSWAAGKQGGKDLTGKIGVGYTSEMGFDMLSARYPLTRLMTSPVLIDEYGLGLVLTNVGRETFFSDGGETYFGHNGSTWGFQCLMVAHPSGVGAVVMTNSQIGLRVAEDVVAVIGTKEGWPGYSQPGN